MDDAVIAPKIDRSGASSAPRITPVLLGETMPWVGSVLCDADTATVLSSQLQVGKVAAYSRRSREKDSSNEDSAVVVPLGNPLTDSPIGDRGVVLAVADGVGGLPEGARASQLALETLLESLSRLTDLGRIRTAVLDAIERANRRILALKAGATTLAIATVIDGRFRCYHVGDSEAFVVGGGGVLKYQTLAHGPVSYGVHCGMIDPASALTHEFRNLVSNVVGDREMRIEIGPTLRLAPRDVVLLCSDGVTDNLTSDQICKRISGKTVEAAGEAILAGLANRREPIDNGLFKEDDTTFLIFRHNRPVHDK